MEFRLLGDVGVSIDGHDVDAGPARQRCVLAGLLVDAGRVVSVDQLVDRVWGERPPQRDREVLYSYVSRLRRVLADGGRIERRRGGYLAVVDRAAVDLHRFRDAVASARTAADDDNALLAYELALGLWRGEAFGGLDSPWLTGMRAALAAERHAAELDRNDVALRLGDHAGLTCRLGELARAHPLDERLAGQLMLALHRSGRSADALAVARRTRRLLADELGVDPGADLRRLELSILRGDPVDPDRPGGGRGDPGDGAGGRGGGGRVGRPSVADDGGSGAGPGGGPRGADGGRRLVPRQLPADVATFTGREAEVEQVLACLAHGPPATVVITAIDGMAGIGKTALAVHVAHRLASRFPDGQLFVDLHGFTEGRAPLDADAALEVLLRAVGVPGERVPGTAQERAGLWRSRLADRRLLVVLDNAAAEAQVTPLLPGTPGCLVLVTSRRRLAGLDHASPVSLDVLPPADAAALFCRIAGNRIAIGHVAAARGDGDHSADNGAADAAVGLVAEVVELCGRLPLAVRIAAARWRGRPSWTLTDLRDRLADTRHRLSELRAGDRSVEAAFRLSYQHLPASRQLVFRRLGCHPGADFDAPAAAALADVDAAETVAALEDLVDAHLLLPSRSGRYQFHDLLRGFASSLAGEDQERATAATRLTDHYS